MGKPNTKKMQAECDAFNAKNSVGSDVFVKLDFVDEPFRTRTKSTAQILSGHSAVIWLENVSGCYLLDRVSAVPNDRVEGRDAASSRRVPSHDGLCGNGTEVGADDTAMKGDCE
ncbi:MAG: hypothetical protein A3K04_02385 [Gallionellales bacterium RBG_16_56_9]|nr:MAG: hypothetical protein A3K04_02385 [Gallionellales bacterium RBG_16_56_9]